MTRIADWGMIPGLTTAQETFESAYTWGRSTSLLYTGGVIDAGALDPTNTPTFELRQGLLLGQKYATGTWTNYSPTASDGSEVARGVLVTQLRMQDFQGNTQAKFFGILVGGPIQSAKIIGLDAMARSQMSKFVFDDVPGGYVGNHQFPYLRFQHKTANYTLVALDNLSVFDNQGAVAEVDFTLPAIGPGYFFGFKAVADFTLKVISAEGANIVALNNAAASSVAFSTATQIIGGGVRVYSNPAGTLWYVENASAGANTITVA